MNVNNNNNNNINNNNYIELEKKEPTTPSILKDFPDELILEIFSYLSFDDLATLRLVSKTWNQIATDEKLTKKKEIYTKIAFGNDKWARCFGDDMVKDEDRDEEFASLPWNIAGILESRCPVYPDQRIKDTHMLVRLPKTLNGDLP